MSRCIIQYDDVSSHPGDARRAVIAAAEALGVEGNFASSFSWVLQIDKEDRSTFLELARELANELV